MTVPLKCPHCGEAVVDWGSGEQAAVCAACGAAIARPAAPVAVAVALPRDDRGPAWIALAVGLAILLFCGALVASIGLSFLSTARESVRSTQCSNNLREIALALNAYHDAHGTYPPAYLADAKGKPTHSWRVLVLPFLGQQELFDEYDFSQPWNGPANRRLLERMPNVYRCPAEENRASTDTSYAMIVAAGTISDGPTGAARTEISDGTGKTLLVVESSPSGIAWLEPRDLDGNRITYVVNDPQQAGGIRSRHPDEANAVTCSARSVTLSNASDEEQVKADTTIAGGESFGSAWDSGE